ncbi:uncharacterized protein DUF1396 [Actinomadura hallensis]|uniref:Uncharacterized protein DUF1396 n=1 Tax=Actinomadura hallensis TaxID=337895 RepID=A0A543IM72_9ACTN|nr:LppX_LprAFG lipoprotein [Actinomadura hallensis]TQM71680.1 uncharacterized protein DUF1396 [Actinomadura hallensis]
MIRRFVTGVALATGLALSLTGCLGGAGEKVGEAGENLRLTAAQVLGKAAEKTGQLDTFAADMSMEMTGTDQGAVSFTGQMQYQVKPDLAYAMKFDDMSVGGQTMAGMEQRLVGRTMYMKMPAMPQLGGGNAAKPWLKISLDELGRQSGLNIDQLLQQSQQMDPVQNTKMLTASKDVREVGKETVDGVETTHYTGTYRVEDAVAQLPADQQDAIRKTYGQLGMDDMKFDLWVDDQQLPRKMAMKSQQTASGVLSMTITYRDFGKPVNIAEPPASQVTDFSEMMRNLGGGLPGA